jgi:hypothetical protein
LTNREPSSIDGIINALYGALSFDPGGRPDLPRLRELFSEGARLLEVADGEARTTDLAGFVRRLEDRLAGEEITSLSVRELARRTDVFGAIAQIFATFERSSGDRCARGINSIQLRNDGARWWIESLMWAHERDDLPLPEAYLPRPARGDELMRRRRARTLRTQPHGPDPSR